MFTEIIIVINSVILPFYYSFFKSILAELKQYGVDLMEMSKLSYNDSAIEIGKKYQEMKYFRLATIFAIIVLILQFVLLLYRLNYKYFYSDQTFLSIISVILMVLCLLLPITLLLFFNVINDKNVGKIILNTRNILKSSLMYMSGVFVGATTLYLFIFNSIYYIKIARASF